MQAALLFHIGAGFLGLVSGATALYAAKGSGLHRRSGMLFVLAMLAMSISGAAIAALQAVEVSVIAGLLAAYLVATGLATVRSPGRPTLLGSAVVGSTLGLASATMGLEAIAVGDGTRDGYPAGLFLAFGVVALLAAVGDLRVRHPSGVSGRRRLRRHLWRMCTALFIATSSFFLGQADELPEALRIPAVLAILAFLPLAVMAYWLRRVRLAGVSRGLEGVSFTGWQS
jgi:hypothetical protein